MNDTVNDNELIISGYDFYRKDRVKGRGGGILMYVKSSLICNRRIDIESSNTDENEILVCDLNCANNKFLIVGVHRPPNCSDKFNHNLVTVLQNIHVILEML